MKTPGQSAREEMLLQTENFARPCLDITTKWEELSAVDRQIWERVGIAVIQNQTAKFVIGETDPEGAVSLRSLQAVLSHLRALEDLRKMLGDYITKPEAK